jgi:ribosomal protein L3 glutamine methyltransferase
MGLSTQQYIEQITGRFEAAGLFFGHGTDNAWDEACWLLETLLRRHGYTDISGELPVPDVCRAEAEQLVNARITTRKPLAYLLGEAWFCGLAFLVNEHVLVPRSPVAELVANDFQPMLKSPPGRILDLCTGSGCIGIACAMTFPDAQVVLSDISPEALSVAEQNIARFSLQNRVTAVQSDLFESIKGKFDLIVTNPPYVGRAEYRALPEEFFREPELGLVTEQDGLAIPLQILANAARYLEDGGWLVMEVGNSEEALAAAVPGLPLLWLEFEHGGTGVCAVRKQDLIPSC